MGLDNDIALVTGASRGIGKACALRLAALGARVVATATSEKGLRAIADYFAAHDIKGWSFLLNLSDASSIDALLAEFDKRAQWPSILVNNAAITRDALAMRMRDDDWDAVLTTNLTGAFRLTRGCLRAMTKARGGRIINISSVVGVTGNPGQTNYAAAKAGLIGFGRALAREVGSRNITVNAIAPGFIDTDMTRGLGQEQRDALLTQIPLARLGSPEDIAYAVAFLASPEASYITGTTLHINGGMYMN
ncbi:3-oxoacyl-ACP reductase FabG [Acidiferrobacter sp.]|jgi:3-oxoacyl-[acyl-carrier protein] reductase|uniref:3-oxoacyl-ACP reductase FabG n=2 Tax=Acidiferrobacter sp. TaxID=1872107 RepID=UPI00261AB794|nr:3-oxoacyl-ACP reductase FabG [Acidiferrobacter sp.]